MRKALPILLLLLACARFPETREPVVFTLGLPPALKSEDPEDEDLVSDLNILLYDGNGQLEEHRFVSRRFLAGDCSFVMNLLAGGTYTLCVCANMGYALDVPHSLDSLQIYRFHLAYPDEYPKGIPMTGCLEYFTPEETDGRIPLRRMMARVTVGMDRGALDGDVRMYVHRISVENCPSSALLFGDSSARSEEDVFVTGFSKSEEAVEPLNRTPSGTVDLYILENDGEICPTWIEMDLEYHSDQYHTPPGKYLKYRFYTGPLMRNTRRCITVRPEGDGLCQDTWKADRTALEAVD